MLSIENLVLSGESYSRSDFANVNSGASRVRVIDPVAAHAYNDWGVARFRKDEVSGAILDYDQAIAINPGMAAAYLNRGAAYHSMGNSAEALSDLSGQYVSIADRLNHTATEGRSGRKRVTRLERSQLTTPFLIPGEIYDPSDICSLCRILYPRHTKVILICGTNRINRRNLLYKRVTNSVIASVHAG